MIHSWGMASLSYFMSLRFLSESSNFKAHSRHGLRGGASRVVSLHIASNILLLVVISGSAFRYLKCKKYGIKLTRYSKTIDLYNYLINYTWFIIKCLVAIFSICLEDHQTRSSLALDQIQPIVIFTSLSAFFPCVKGSSCPSDAFFCFVLKPDRKPSCQWANKVLLPRDQQAVTEKVMDSCCHQEGIPQHTGEWWLRKVSWIKTEDIDELFKGDIPIWRLCRPSTSYYLNTEGFHTLF